MYVGLHHGKDNIMLEQDYFIDETNNGWVNGVPARVANQQMNNYLNNIRTQQLLQQSGYTQPQSFRDWLGQMLNVYLPQQERFTPDRQPRKRVYYPNAIGF